MLSGVAALALVGCLVSIPELRVSPAPIAQGGAGGDAAQPEPRCGQPFVAPELERQFPVDAGLLDVTREPYGAKADGITDDTAALQRAISDSAGTGRIVFLPAGTYAVSATLEALDADGAPQPSLTLQGAGRELTRIRLADDALDFDDPLAPKSVLKLRETPAGTALRNHVMDLSVDVAGHAGAIALDFVGHNRSGVENVALHADPGAGAVGLLLERPWAGSRLIRNLSVEGFDVGVSIAQEKFGNTFEHVELSNQRRCGILNDRSFSVIRDLRSRNEVPAIQNTHALGMLVLVEAELVGGAADQAAVVSEGELFARDVTVAGYGPAIELRGLEVARGNVEEFSSREPARLAGRGTGSLGLTMRETPEPQPPPLDDWQSVVDSGAVAGDALDDSAAIQAALDSGKPAVYLPFGRYSVGKTLTIPPSVSLIFGAESTLQVTGEHDFAEASAGEPVPLFRSAEGAAPLRIERLLFTSAAPAELGLTLFEHLAPREVTLAFLEGAHLAHWPLLYRAQAGAGQVFFHNVHAGGIRVVSGQQAFLRACNFEAQDPMVDNAGAELWALGLKSYTPHTLIATRAGGKTELLGAFLLPEPEEAAPTPAFTIDDAEASLVFATYTDRTTGEYPIHVRETRAGVSRELLPDAERVLGSGSYVPLFIGHDETARRCR